MTVGRRVRRGGQGLQRAARRTWRRLTAARLPDEPGEATRRARPIFVGGTGRSGTTVVARLVGAHPAYHMFTTELRFIAAPGGVCDLVDGRTGFRQFERDVRERWFDRGAKKGLHTAISEAEVDAALARMAVEFRRDPPEAARRFVHRLLDPIAFGAGATGWVESTPANVFVAPTLLRLFPEAVLIHSVRDGRDVACSVIGFGWGPRQPDEALDWWARRLERGFRASASLSSDRLLVVQMEALIADHRSREYERLLTLLGLDDAPAMRTYFESAMTPDRAHIARWRTDVPPEQLPAFEAHHDRLAARLRDRGWPYHPADTLASGLPGH